MTGLGFRIFNSIFLKMRRVITEYIVGLPDRAGDSAHRAGGSIHSAGDGTHSAVERRVHGVLGALGGRTGQKPPVLGEHRIWRSVQFWLHPGKVT